MNGRANLSGLMNGRANLSGLTNGLIYSDRYRTRPFVKEDAVSVYPQVPIFGRI